MSEIAPLPFTPDKADKTVLVTRRSGFEIVPMKLSDQKDDRGDRYAYMAGEYGDEHKPVHDALLDDVHQEELTDKFHQLGREHGGLALRGDKVTVKINGKLVEGIVGDHQRIEAKSGTYTQVEVAALNGDRVKVPLADISIQKQASLKESAEKQNEARADVRDAFSNVAESKPVVPIKLSREDILRMGEGSTHEFKPKVPTVPNLRGLMNDEESGRVSRPTPSLVEGQGTGNVHNLKPEEIVKYRDGTPGRSGFDYAPAESLASLMGDGTEQPPTKPVETPKLASDSLVKVMGETPTEVDPRVEKKRTAEAKMNKILEDLNDTYDAAMLQGYAEAVERGDHNAQYRYVDKMSPALKANTTLLDQYQLLHNEVRAFSK